MIDDNSASLSETSNDYSDVTEMFRRLAELDRDSAAHRKQRDAII